MAWFRQLARAPRNLARIARQNPVWAIQSLVFAPFRFARHLLGVVVLMLAVAIVLILGTDGLIWYFGLARYPTLVAIVQVLIWLAILVVPLRALFQPLILRYGGADADDTHGSARFATDVEARDLMGDAGLLIGRDRKSGKLLRYPGPAHLLTIAPTRSGKGVGTIIPNLIDYPFASVCIDPKGENARIAARQRRGFGPVHILDPFGITGRVPAAFNPLDRIDPTSLDVADDCMTLADALVHDAHNQQTEAHWNEEAKVLITGLLMHIVASEPASTRTLATLREHLTLAPAAFLALLERMQGQGGLVARAAKRHLGKSGREAAGVLSSAQRHTHFLDSPRMTATLGHSDFRFADLKERPASIFLVLPPDRLDTYARWLRLMGPSANRACTGAGTSGLARAVPTRRVRSTWPPRARRARDGANGGLWHPALADRAGHPPAARALRPAGRHLPVQRRRPAGVRCQRSAECPACLRPAWPGDGRVRDDEHCARRRGDRDNLRSAACRKAAPHT